MTTSWASEHDESNRRPQTPSITRYIEALGLRRAPQRDNWQVLPTPTITHIESNNSAAITGDRRVRRCARSPSRPTYPRLDAWPLIGRWDAMIDLIGCVALQTRVRPVIRIPFGKQRKLLAEGLATKWYQDNACTFVLKRQDESLDQGIRLHILYHQ